ncbi:MAG: type II toxin-antitoxin system VapC family toxin [Candidatus Dormibacteria bacterium]
MLYEVMNALARQLWDGVMTLAEADVVWAQIDALEISRHPFDPAVDGPRSLAIAQTLKRRHATDCSYLSLAERLGAAVWTLDGSFARAGQTAGFAVRLLA